MALNWVMLTDDGGFALLPSEYKLHQTPARVALELSTVNTYPGSKPFLTSASNGIAYLTNHRIIYLSDRESADAHLQSFMCNLEGAFNANVTAPFFGPNSFTAIVRPIPGGNIPSSTSNIQLRLTFKEGGAYDFLTIFQRLSERRLQDIEVSRMSENNSQSTHIPVNIESLPTYSEVAQQEDNVTQSSVRRTPDERPPDYDPS